MRVHKNTSFNLTMEIKSYNHTINMCYQVRNMKIKVKIAFKNKINSYLNVMKINEHYKISS